jgi:hypothetical protein
VKLEIDFKKLIDSPIETSFDELVTNYSENSDDLVSDIVLAPPTCYLISGYRGAGKSSFINRIKAKAIAKKSTYQ